MSTDGHSDRTNLLVTPPYPMAAELRETKATKVTFRNNDLIVTNYLQEACERKFQGYS